MKDRSTQAVVGLCGNDSTMTRGLGQDSSQACMSPSKKASPGSGASTESTSGPCRGTWRTSAPANSGPQMWIGYDGEGTSAVSPGPTSTHIRCEKPSLAPMVVTTWVSGSSSTANLRR